MRPGDVVALFGPIDAAADSRTALQGATDLLEQLASFFLKV
jgi:hypothetical protein